MAFQKIVTFALSADYSRSDWFEQHPTLRFATEVVNRNQVVATMVELHGHSYEFSIPSEQTNDPDDPDSENGSAESNDVELRFQEDVDELDELTAGVDSLSTEPTDDIMSWLTRVYETSRGFELGTFDSSLLALTMKTQSSNWEAIAFGFVKDVICMAHKFIKVLMGLVCPDQRVQSALHSVLMDELFAKYRKALNHVIFLLKVERCGTPATLDPNFNENLQARYVVNHLLSSHLRI
jgi:hypothetical protein